MEHENKKKQTRRSLEHIAERVSSSQLFTNVGFKTVSYLSAKMMKQWKKEKKEKKENQSPERLQWRSTRHHEPLLNIVNLFFWEISANPH